MGISVQTIEVVLRCFLEHLVMAVVIIALAVFAGVFAAFVLRRLGMLLRTGIVLSMLAVAMVLVSDKPPPSETNNNDNAGAPVRGMRLTGSSVVPGIGELDEATNGWHLVSVSSNVFNASTFAMPTNAVVWEDARECGAGYGAWRIQGGGWEFPFNGPVWTNGFLWVEGVFRSRFGNRADEIQMLDERLTLCPQEHWADFNLPSSRAWYVTNGVGGLVATFENAALGDDTNKIVSAQMELDPTQGEITLRYDLRSVGDLAFSAGPIMGGESNLVSVSSNTSAMVFRRVHPNDWDWDGLPNALDDHPRTPLANPVWNQSEEWAALAFPSNAAEIVAAGGYLAWAMARGAQPNRHLIGLEISSPSNIWPICLTFGDQQVMCDGKQMLYFVIDDGTRYSFELSDGVLAAMEFGEGEREEWLWCDWSAPYDSWSWPSMVSYHMDSARKGWIGRMPTVEVDGLDYRHFFPGDTMSVLAEIDNCHPDSYISCDWSSPDPGITFADSHSLQTTIAWQGPGVANWASNRVTLVTTYAGEYAVTNNYVISIGILSEPVTTLEVSCPAIQFLNDGTNDYDRAERVYPVTVNLLAARGTEGRLSIHVEDGTRTSVFHDMGRMDSVGDDEEIQFNVPSGEGFTSSQTLYMTSAGLGRGRLWALYSLTNGTAVCNTGVTFQVIEPIRKLINDETMQVDGRYVNPSRLVRGTNAVLKASVKLAVGDSFIMTNMVFHPVSGPGRIISEWRTGNDWYASVEATSGDGDFKVEARFNNDPIQPKFILPVVEERVLNVRAFIVKEPPSWIFGGWDEKDIRNYFKVANEIFTQAGVRFELIEVKVDETANPSDWFLEPFVLSQHERGEERGIYSDSVRRLVNLHPTNDCIKVIFTGPLQLRNVSAFTILPAAKMQGIIIGMGATSHSLAHELGHALGLEGCLESIGDEEDEAFVCLEKNNFPMDASVFGGMDGDWMEETGNGFYERNDTLGKMLKKLLMWEVISDDKCDIPDGTILSLRNGAADFSDVWYPKVGAKHFRQSNQEVYTNERR